MEMLALRHSGNKIYASFPSAQFIRYHTPYCVDINNKTGGILVYVKSSIPFTFHFL